MEKLEEGHGKRKRTFLRKWGGRTGSTPSWGVKRALTLVESLGRSKVYLCMQGKVFNGNKGERGIVSNKGLEWRGNGVGTSPSLKGGY